MVLQLLDKLLVPFEGVCDESQTEEGNGDEREVIFKADCSSVVKATEATFNMIYLSRVIEVVVKSQSGFMI